jgi:hypothetical protein
VYRRKSFSWITSPHCQKKIFYPYVLHDPKSNDLKSPLAFWDNSNINPPYYAAEIWPEPKPLVTPSQLYCTQTELFSHQRIVALKFSAL